MEDHAAHPHDIIFCISCGKDMQRRRIQRKTEHWTKIRKCWRCKAKKKRGGIHLEDAKFCRRCGKKYTFAAYAEFLSSSKVFHRWSGGYTYLNRDPDEVTVAESAIRSWRSCALCLECGYPHSREQVEKDKTDRVMAAIVDRIRGKAERKKSVGKKKSVKRPSSRKELEDMIRNAYGISAEEFADTNTLLCRVLAILYPREEQILRMRYGIGENVTLTLEATAKRFAVSGERIRQLEQKALKKILDNPARRLGMEAFIYIESLLKP